MATTAPALWRQLQSVAAVLIAIRNGKSWTAAHDGVEPALRVGVRALSYTVLRHVGSAQGVRDLLVKRTPAAAIDALLCSALALAIADFESANNSDVDTKDPAYDEHTLVNQAVEAAKHNHGTYAQAGFLNGCLRRFLREKPQLLGLAQQKPQARWNHPAWWIARLRNDYPAQWQALLQANNQPAALTLRINTAKTSRDQYCKTLTDMNLTATKVGNQGLQLGQGTYIPDLPGYEEGLFSVQDAAAQLAAPLLLEGFLDESRVHISDNQSCKSQPSGRLRVLDACAAPGGKTAHLLEFASTHQLALALTALDIDTSRCQRIHDNLQRLNLQAEVLAADAAQPATWWDGELFDAILLDAPCTASGIVRRHPDVRWLRRETDIAQLAEQQKTLLYRLWPLLAKNGKMLYCTCSVFKTEGQNQMEAFVANNTDATLLPSPGHLLPQNGREARAMPHNHLGVHDGFYYALLQKKYTSC